MNTNTNTNNNIVSQPQPVQQQSSNKTKNQRVTKLRPASGIIGQQYTDGVDVYVCTASGTPATWTKVCYS